MKKIVNTPAPPYHAVVFTSKKIDDNKEYAEIAKKMAKLIKKQDGFWAMSQPEMR